MPRKSIPPVSSFGSELLATLLRGAQASFEIPCGSFETAFALRQRLYALRKSLKAESHPSCSTVYRVSIALPSKSGILTLRPKDEEFTSILRAAGIAATPQEEGGAEATETPMAPDYIANLLRDVEVTK